MNAEMIRAMVRPLITVLLVSAFIVGAFFDVTAAGVLKELVLIAVGFWFGSRTK